MNYIETEMKGLWILEPKVLGDDRGYFMETYKKEDFDSHIGKTDFIQDNESSSSFGVLRGLHVQSGDTAQAKLVRVTTGKVLDVAVDVRKNSPTFGQYKMVELSSENKRQFFIPRGFAHGFIVLSEIAVFNYKVDNTYSPSTEITIDFHDPEINIPWPLEPSQLVLSEKDKKGKSLKEIQL
ncbi:MAG: 5-epimerase [Candidatus Ordinivivax streblomastigis]|uniref:dTDP-4-dehydrorhamnose 3,5-epimerase n=1 Tax=Candidatus Ordinivivax streblomastigis TaxID=2540710 RepID=A0A5M8P0G0_9BACT|nr:MAG: 5-epimerase [Candidatus Ordinivivax streblomastigis]